MDTSHILQSAFKRNGYHIEELKLGSDKKEFIQVWRPDKKAAWTFSPRGPLYPFLSASARQIAGDKVRSYDFAELHKVPVPELVYIDQNIAQIKAFLKKHDRLIVKPTDQAFSSGVTVDITTMEELSTAIEYAKRWSEKIIVQQQVYGDEVRFLVIDGVARAAVLRQTPRVIGDGRTSLRELIQQENDARHRINHAMVPYPALDDSLITTRPLHEERIPKTGEVIELSKSTRLPGGASIYNITDKIDSSYLPIVERLGRSLGRGLIVVDMMLQDYTKPALSDNYNFLEFNLAPALPLFYSCRDGEHVEVAEKYLVPMIDKLLEQGYL